MQPNKYIFVAYYTIRTDYEQIVENLRKSLQELNLKFDIQGYPSRGTWQNNIAFKPEFIYEMMRKWPRYDIVYVDADAVVRKFPKYFDTFQGDIGVHYKDNVELLSGTIYLKNVDKVQTLVKAWMSDQQHHPAVWDQKTLQRILMKRGGELQVNIVNIPANYTQIFDLMKNAGEPVIEHFQASRQARKKEFKNKEDMPYLESILGVRIRLLSDNTFCIPRRNSHVEEILDKNYTRVPNELRWYPKHLNDRKFTELKDVFNGNTTYIVGKGPSLDRLTASMFTVKDAAIICTNEAIHKVESLDLPNRTFMMQQDIWLKESCRPKKAGIILSYRVRTFYPDYPDRYIFFGPEVGAPIACLTASYAICLAKKLGSTNFKMVCFDACVNQTIGYAKCIGNDPSEHGKPDRFLKHRRAYDIYIGKTPVEWLLPQ